MRQMVKFGIILAMICLVASMVLAVTYKVTKPEIEAAAAAEEREALRKILPGAERFVKKEVDGLTYYEGYEGEKLVGYCVKGTSQGYAAYIHLMVGIDPSGTIEGVEILDQQETPGLGAKIDETKPGQKEPWFLRQFKGKDSRTVSLKDIDAVTGATISSRAVITAVTGAADTFFKKGRDGRVR